MIPIVAALVAAFGAHLLYTSVAFGWSGCRLGPRRATPQRRRRRLAVDQWLVQAGLPEVRRREFVAVIAALAGIGAILGGFLFCSGLPALALGLFALTFPMASYRQTPEAPAPGPVHAGARKM